MSNNKEISFSLIDWMVNKLGLKNNDLIMYALVYSFSNQANGAYNGGLNYLCKRANISKTTALRSLQKLTVNGYLIKTPIKKNGVEYNEYRHSPEKLKELGLEEFVKNMVSRNENQFIKIYDWMITEHNLTAHSLVIFAMIYSFTRYNGCFVGNYEYIAKRLNMSSMQVKRIMDKLISSGLVTVAEPYNQQTKRTVYKSIQREIFTDEDSASSACNNNSNALKNNIAMSSDIEPESVDECEIDDFYDTLEQEQDEILSNEISISFSPIMEHMIREQVKIILEEMMDDIVQTVLIKLKERMIKDEKKNRQ